MWSIFPGQAATRRSSDLITYTTKLLETNAAALIAYWPLAEASGTTIVDESGNARNGAYRASGEPLLAQTGIGDSRTAATFDGSNDYGNVFSSSLQSAFNGAEGTTAIWGIVSGSGVWTDATQRRLVRFAVDANNVISIQKTTTNNQLSWSYVAGGTSNTRSKTTSAPTTWLHLALTWSKSADQVIAYYNGVQEGATMTGLGTFAGSLASTTVCVGAQSTSGTQGWGGTLAHAAVWTTPLTAAQIAALAAVP